jgi:hypothetical protein
MQRDVEGYEMGWQALNIERSLDGSRSSSEESSSKQTTEKIAITGAKLAQTSYRRASLAYY